MWSKILLLFFVFSFLFRTDHSFDQDFGRHLKIGEIIWQTKQVPLTNLFSYTYPDFPFINSHWLFELLAYLGQQTIGLQAILVLKLVIFLLAVYFILAIIPKNQYLLLPIGFIFLHTLRERPELRPEIFSFLFTALTIYILDKFEKTKSKLIFALPIIQFLWVNIHIYFIVGIALQFIFLVHFVFYKRLKQFKAILVIILFSTTLSLVNPSGAKGILNPFLYITNYGYNIVENQTMFLLESINFRDPNFLFVKLAFGIIVLSLIWAFFRKRFTLLNLGLSGFGLVLALLNVRSFPYLVFISLPAVLDNFGTGKLNIIGKIIVIVTVPLLLYESFLYLNGDYYKYTNADVSPRLEFKENGKKALNFVLVNKLPQPIFNNFDIGSYITYRGWPEYRIFVDGRPGEYPKEFFINIYIPAQYDYNKFKALDKLMGFKTIIFSHTDQTPWGKNFLQNVIKDPDWKIVYIDDFMIVLVKDTRELPIIDLAKLSPDSYKFSNHVSYLRLGLFLLNNQYIESGRLFIEKTLQLFPDDPIANSLIGRPTKNNFFW